MERNAVHTMIKLTVTLARRMLQRRTSNRNPDFQNTK